METDLSKEKKTFFGKYNLLVHAAIMLVIMFAIGNCAPIGSITPLGMRFLGIFIAVLYGWSTCGLFWPSLIAIVALAFSGMFETLSGFLAISFGNDVLVFILFLFAFAELLNSVGLVDYILNRMISIKVVNNRPWLFSFVFLMGTYICSGFVNMFMSIIVSYSILLGVFKKFDIKPYGKYPVLMYLGITIASLFGGSILPFNIIPLVVWGTYASLTGLPLDLVSFMLYMVPMSILIVIAYILICRFIFRPDLGKLKNVNSDFVDKEKLILSKKQKVVILYLVIFVVMMLLPNLLPKTMALKAIFTKLGLTGIMLIMIVMATLIKIDGEALMDFQALSAKSVRWDVFCAVVFIIPFAGIFTSDATGIKQFIVETVQPLLGTLSPVAFVIAIMLILTVLTNFANNMIMGAVFTTVLYSVSGSLGMDATPLVALLIVCVNLSIATPAACPNAAIMFGNTDWCRRKDFYKYGTLSAILLLIVALSVGLLWANVIY